MKDILSSLSIVERGMFDFSNIPSDCENLGRDQFSQKYCVNFEILEASNPPLPLYVGAEGMPLVYNGPTLTTICGNSGVGKSSFLTLALYGRYANSDTKILWVDTEQPAPALKKLMMQICCHFDKPMACNQWLRQHLALLSVRNFMKDDALAVIKRAVASFNPGLIVLDNIADLIDDETNATEIKELLLRFFPSLQKSLESEEGALMGYGIPIITVVHKNKQGQEKGHIGSLLLQKSDVFIDIANDSNNPNILKIEHRKHRYGSKASASARFEDANYVSLTNESYSIGMLNWIDQKKNYSTKGEERADFVCTFMESEKSYSEEQIIELYSTFKQHKCSSNAVANVIAACIREGLIMQDGDKFKKVEFVIPE